MTALQAVFAMLTMHMLCQLMQLCSHMTSTCLCYWSAQAQSPSENNSLFGYRDWSNLVVRVLPNVEAAVDILGTCQTAILQSNSTVIRHRAISIMRAMSTLLDAASPQLAEEVHPHAQQGQHIRADVPSANVTDLDKDPTSASAEQATGEESAEEVAQSAREFSASTGSQSDATQFNMERAFAKEFILAKRSASAAQTHQQSTASSDLLSMQQQQAAAALSAANNNSTQAATDPGDEADAELGISPEEEENEAMAAAHRQQIVDDLVDKLFEESVSGGCSSQPGSDNAMSDQTCGSDGSDLVCIGSHDSGLLSDSSAGRSMSASLPSAQSSDSSVTRSASEERAAQQSNFNPEEEGVKEEEVPADVNKVMAALGLQGHPGLGRALQQVLQPLADLSPNPTPDPTASSSTLKGKGRAGATPRQALIVPGVGPRVAVGVTAGSGAKPAVKPTAQLSAAPKRVASPDVKQLKGLLPVLSSRGSKKPRTGEEEPALVPGQQAAGLVGQTPGSSDPKGGFSQDQLQAMVDLVFKAGFEHMGQLANASAETAADFSVESDTAAATSPQALIDDDDEQDTSDHDLQHAFKQLVECGLQKQDQSSRQIFGSSAPSQAVARDTALPAVAATERATVWSEIATAQNAAAMSSAAATTAAAADATAAAAGATAAAASQAAATAASSTTQQIARDSVPGRLVARERERVARVLAEDQLPPFHSVYSRYDRHQHVNEVHELTECHRQVGFDAPGTSVKCKPF